MGRRAPGLGKSGTAINSLLRMFRLAHGSEEEPREVSTCIVDKENLGQPVTYNPQGYLMVKRRIHEIDAEKGMVIIEARHDRWKAGGPL